MNHNFLVSVLTNDFKSHDLGLTAKNLRGERDPSKHVKLSIDKEAVVGRLMQLLDIRNLKDQKIAIDIAHVLEIKDYLRVLDLIIECPFETFHPEIKPKDYVIFVQPGMRYCQAQTLVHSIMKDEQFSILEKEKKDIITNRILSDVKGRMLEDIVLLETSKHLKSRYSVFKLFFEIGEFDMVIYDKKSHSCDIFEIKHSDEAIPAQYQHLIDEDKCSKTEFRFGQIVGRHGLYRGASHITDDGIQSENVEQYLKLLPNKKKLP
jgi:hypothetical protein